jgi:hypothetical protein
MGTEQGNRYRSGPPRANLGDGADTVCAAEGSLGVRPGVRRHGVVQGVEPQAHVAREDVRPRRGPLPPLDERRACRRRRRRRGRLRDGFGTACMTV